MLFLFYLLQYTENSAIALKANAADRPDHYVDLATPAVNNTANKITKPVMSMKAKQTGAEKEASTSVSNIVQSCSSISPLSDDHIYGNQELSGRPIPVDELSSYVEEMLKRKDGFKKEYTVMTNILELHAFLN